MDRIRNVIVFGDSLSDIGKKRFTASGRFAFTMGLITTNPSGRFSDCRNWTDFMFEDATGRSIIGGNVNDTIARSREYMRIGMADAVRGVDPDSWFHYANYAEGGAIGSSKGWNWRRLGTFKDQVHEFEADWKAFQRRQTYNRAHGSAPKCAQPDLTLFLVWFGSNDIYTLGREAHKMSQVAYEVSGTYRQKLKSIVGEKNARFIFFSAPKPKASPRLRSGMNRLLVGDKTYRMVKGYDDAASQYNYFLRNNAIGNGDVFIDINKIIDPLVIKLYAEQYSIRAHSFQPKGHSKLFRSPQDIANVAGKHCEATSDQTHPSDRMYRLAWDRFRVLMTNSGVRFGNIGPQVPRGIAARNTPAQDDVTLPHTRWKGATAERRLSI